MDAAEKLVDKIFSLVALQKICADKFNELATELEKRRKGVNISQVVGSSASVAGAAAVTAAGVLTGGAIFPFLLVGAGGIASAIGFGTNVGSEVVDVRKSKAVTKEAEDISEKIKNLEEEIQILMKSVVEEGKKADGCGDVPPEDYVMEQILREMAKRSGLKLHVNVSVLKTLSSRLEKEILNSESGLHRWSLSGLHLLTLIGTILSTTAKASKKGSYTMVMSSVDYTASKVAMKMATSTGSKVSSKALKYVTGGAIGLVFTVPELIFNCVYLNKTETDNSKSLRDSAEAMFTSSENMEKELNNIKQQLAQLAEVKLCIDNSNRSPENKKKLIEFAIELCEDEDVRQWLRENLETEVFCHLVDMFKFLREEFDKKKKKTNCEDIDIIFVAHGAIEASLIPLRCLLPLSTITDVLLYSPWNCAIDADVAYGVATGHIRPQHRVFCCGEEACEIPDEGHQPTNLPNRWNSMKAAEGWMIPNIIVGPLTPKDGAWEHFVELQNEYGQPSRNRIVIPFILPDEIDSLETVPFSVITLALSLVLVFTGFRATVHLAACLSKISARLPENYLKEQYACTIDHTAMTASNEMLVNRDTDLYRAFKAVFG